MTLKVLYKYFNCVVNETTDIGHTYNFNYNTNYNTILMII